MKAMILAAGRGERLRPLTEQLPKPLIPIGGAPLIEHQLRWLQRAGITEVVINLHHLGERIAETLGDGSDIGVRIAYSHEETLLDTGGGVKAALPLLGNAPFLLLNGDIWTSYPFRELVGRHPTAAHIVLTPRPKHRSQGDFAVHGEHAQHHGDQRDDHVFCGIAVVNPTLFAETPDGPFDIARRLYFPAAAAGQLTGELFDGAWFDIGSHDQLKAARRFAE